MLAEGVLGLRHIYREHVPQPSYFLELNRPKLVADPVMMNRSCMYAYQGFQYGPAQHASEFVCLVLWQIGQPQPYCWLRESPLIFESQFAIRGIYPDTYIEAGHAVVSRFLAVLLRSVKDAYFRGWERTPYFGNYS